MEKWLDVVGYEGIYEISDEGRVRSKEGKTTFSKQHGTRSWKGRLLKPRPSTQGYLRVSLFKNKKRKEFLIHRLVAEAFIPNPDNKEIINHKDGNKRNNNLKNIEWCNYKDNLQHAYDNKLNKREKTIKITNKATKQEFVFRNMQEASGFLGKSRGFVSNILKQNRHEYKNFIITPF